ncbi:lipocalin family protein [Roseospira goensis]|uniref:Outer membrane lipoprotein Blc n=1 Tax=Roseospira goensis TaxID=391922 RepID=A0A7W6RY76_9PROT|nr:lipocalin family protein [Roseospira goensis]MBB4284769.1 apolipoprotein D and lipocalin family protein [Roseospira goensis]
MTAVRMRPMRPTPPRRWAGVALLLGALGALAACTGVPRGVTPVDGFEADRFTGTWYEIMRLDHPFEAGLTNVRATYRLRDDGTVAVFNRGWDPAACAWKTIGGTARFREGPQTGSFAVTLTSPIPGALHVVALDREDYRWAMTSGPTRDFLWILARERTLPRETRVALMRQARDLGYPVEDLRLVDQSGPVCRER